jgi:hypothetical protein
MSFPKCLRGLMIGLLCTGAMAVGASPARASEVFPGAILEAADMPCVPTCLLCHTSNPGTASTWQTKALPLKMVMSGARKRDADSLKRAFAAYAATASTDPSVGPVLAALQKGEDPESPGTSVCGAIYGCGGARVAKTPPTDRTAIGFAVAAIAAAALLRRRKPAH